MPVVLLTRRFATVLLSLVLLLDALLLTPLAVAAQEASPAPEPATPTASAAPLPTGPEGTWTVVAFDPWGAGLVEPLPESTLMVSLLEGRRLEGETGCGRFTGGWFLEDGVLSMSVSPTGNLGCDERRTEEAIGLEAALAAVTAWRPGISGLELLDATGAIRVTLQGSAVIAPYGSWSVVSYRRPNGRLAEPSVERPMTLELREDGSVAGTTSCRLLEGVYELQGTGAIIGPLETVGLPCEGTEGRAERQLLRALGDVVYWRRDGDTLTLNDGFDELLVELVLTETLAGATP